MLHLNNPIVMMQSLKNLKGEILLTDCIIHYHALLQLNILLTLLMLDLTKFQDKHLISSSWTMQFLIQVLIVGKNKEYIITSFYSNGQVEHERQPVLSVKFLVWFQPPITLREIFIGQGQYYVRKCFSD